MLFVISNAKQAYIGLKAIKKVNQKVDFLVCFYKILFDIGKRIIQKFFIKQYSFNFDTGFFSKYMLNLTNILKSLLCGVLKTR